MKLNRRELATVLSALRLSQWHLEAGSLEEMVNDPDCQHRCDLIDNIASDCGRVTPLDSLEIDGLCQRFNTEAP